MPRRVFVVWLRPPMATIRAESLELIRRHAGVETILLTDDSLAEWILDDAPLHPAFGNLSAVHQSDYLRCYFMHHHGGGYVDLKPLTTSWAPEFDRLDATPGPWPSAIGTSVRSGWRRWESSTCGGRGRPTRPGGGDAGSRRTIGG